MIYSAKDWPHLGPTLFHLISLGSLTLILGTLVEAMTRPGVTSSKRYDEVGRLL